MKNTIRKKNFYLMLFADAVLVVLAYSLAYLIRFEGSISLQEMGQLKAALPFVVPLKLVCFFIFGLYRGMWRYTSLLDLRKVFIATGIASAVIVFSSFTSIAFRVIPVPCMLLTGVSLLCLRAGSGYSYGYCWEALFCLFGHRKVAVVIRLSKSC